MRRYRRVGGPFRARFRLERDFLTMQYVLTIFYRSGNRIAFEPDVLIAVGTHSPLGYKLLI